MIYEEICFLVVETIFPPDESTSGKAPHITGRSLYSGKVLNNFNLQFCKLSFQNFIDSKYDAMADWQNNFRGVEWSNGC